MSVCPSVRRNNLIPTGRISMKFDIWIFFLKISQEKFHEYPTRIKGTLHEGYFIWRVLYMKDALHEGYFTWRVLYMEGTLHEGYFTWRVLYMKGTLHEGHFIWRYFTRRVLYMKPKAHFWSYLLHFFLERVMFQAKFVDKIKTQILNKFFSLK